MNSFLEKLKDSTQKEAFDIINNSPTLLQEGWKKGLNLTIPSYYLNINKILFVGMGASGIIGDFGQSFLEKESDHPGFVLKKDKVPFWVDEKTLVIAISHSGDTTETVSALVSAYQKGAKLISITCQGGKLSSLSVKHKTPLLMLENNDPPRLAFTLMLGGVLAILKKIDSALTINDTKINKAQVFLETETEKLISTSYSQNPVPRLVKFLKDGPIMVWGSENLEEMSLRWAQQIAENGKTMAASAYFPELCHNFIEGLKFPPNSKSKIIILESRNLNSLSQENILLSQKLLKKNKLLFQNITYPILVDVFLEKLYFLILGDLVSCYLAIQNDEDPILNPDIQWLKKNREIKSE